MNMRLHSSLLLALLAAPPPTSAQTHAVPDGWRLGGGVEAVRFGHVAVTDAAPGVAAEIRPSGRAGVHLAATRSSGPWDLSVEAGWATGHIEASNDVVAIRDLTSDVTRYRLAVGLTRSVLTSGAGVVAVGLVPTLDLWAVEGESRLRAGAEGRLVLRVPLGAVELENRVGLGLSGNPIEAADVGETADLRGLRAVVVGVGLRFGA